MELAALLLGLLLIADDGNGRREDSNYLRTGVRQRESTPPPLSSLGFVRRSSAPSYYDGPSNGQMGIGSRALNRPGTSPRKTKEIKKNYLGILGKHALLVIDITAKQIDKGIANIAKNINRHENGKINVVAESPLGRSCGILTENYAKQFFKDRWVGVLAHMAQETVDRFVAGTAEFFAKGSISSLL